MKSKLIKNNSTLVLYQSIRHLCGAIKLLFSRYKKTLKIVIGASGYYDEGWIDTDIEYLNLLNRSHWKRYFRVDSIDAILAEHVWEHLTLEQGLEAEGIQVCRFNDRVCAYASHGHGQRPHSALLPLQAGPSHALKKIFGTSFTTAQTIL